MPINVWHLDDAALFGDSNQEPPKAFYDVKIGFRDDGSQERACSELFRLGFYKLAATVHTDNPNEAWDLTNHIDGNWQRNSKVAAQPGPQRSSCVGDLLENGQGEWSICASVGWRQIPPPIAPRKAPKP